MIILSLPNMLIKCPMHKICCTDQLPHTFTGDVLPMKLCASDSFNHHHCKTKHNSKQQSQCE